MFQIAKKTIKFGLRKAGYRLVRDFSGNCKLDNRVCGPVVEFLGPSGVGKTTLLQALVHRWSDRRRWISQEEAEWFGNRYMPQAGEVPEYYEKLLSHELHSISKRDMPATHKWLIISYCYRVYLRDVWLRVIAKSRFTIMDEGVFQNYASSIVHLAGRDRAGFEEFLKNRAIVYCRGDVDAIIRNIKERELAGIVRVGHIGKDQVELRETVENGNLDRERLVALLKEYGTRYVEIDVADDCEVNVEKVTAFVESVLPPG